MKCIGMLLAAVALLTVTGADPAHATFGNATGLVVTCPGGDPIPQVPVHIFIGPEYRGIVHTDSNGRWVYKVTFEPCEALMTVSFDNQIVPSKQACPKGRHGSGVPCCIQRQKIIPCSGTELVFPDLQFRCGEPGDPPCPAVQ